MIKRFQQGGQVNAEQEAFTAYLIKLFKPSSPEEFESTISQLSEEEIGELYQQYKSMEQPAYAKLGAKVNYISQLNGTCPEGFEVEKFLAGGCVKCKKKKQITPIEVIKESCGGKAKRRIKKSQEGEKLPDTLFKKGGKAFIKVKGGPASSDSTGEMKMNAKQRRKIAKNPS